MNGGLADATLGDTAQSTLIQLVALLVGAWSAYLAYKGRRVQINVRRLRSLTAENDELRDDLLAMAAWAFDVRADLAQRGIQVHAPPRLKSRAGDQAMAESEPD